MQLQGKTICAKNIASTLKNRKYYCVYITHTPFQTTKMARIKQTNPKRIPRLQPKRYKHMRSNPALDAIQHIQEITSKLVSNLYRDTIDEMRALKIRRTPSSIVHALYLKAARDGFIAKGPEMFNTSLEPRDIVSLWEKAGRAEVKRLNMIPSQVAVTSMMYLWASNNGFIVGC